MKTEPVHTTALPNVVRLQQGDQIILLRPEDVEPLKVALGLAAWGARRLAIKEGGQ